MICGDRLSNDRSYNVLSTAIVIVGVLLLVGGLCLLVIGLLG